MKDLVTLALDRYSEHSDTADDFPLSGDTLTLSDEAVAPPIRCRPSYGSLAARVCDLEQLARELTVLLTQAHRDYHPVMRAWDATEYRLAIAKAEVVLERRA